ncbi:MAG: hypothetical protein AAFN79_21865 [Pseudomonadota bacterium]
MALLAAWANIAILMEARRLGVEISDKQLAQGLVGIVMSLLPAAFVFIPAAHRWLFARRENFGADVLFRGLRLFFFVYVFGRYRAKEPFIGIDALEDLSRSAVFVTALAALYFIWAVLPATYGRFLNPRAGGEAYEVERRAVDDRLAAEGEPVKHVALWAATIWLIALHAVAVIGVALLLAIGEIASGGSDGGVREYFLIGAVAAPVAIAYLIVCLFPPLRMAFFRRRSETGVNALMIVLRFAAGVVIVAASSTLTEPLLSAEFEDFGLTTNAVAVLYVMAVGFPGQYSLALQRKWLEQSAARSAIPERPDWRRGEVSDIAVALRPSDASASQRISSLEEAQSANDPLARARASGRLGGSRSAMSSSPVSRTSVVARTVAGAEWKTPVYARVARALITPLIFLILLPTAYATFPPQFIPSPAWVASVDGGSAALLIPACVVSGVLAFLASWRQKSAWGRPNGTFAVLLATLLIPAMIYFAAPLTATTGIPALLSLAETDAAPITRDVTIVDVGPRRKRRGCDMRLEVTSPEYDPPREFTVCEAPPFVHDRARPGMTLTLIGFETDYGMRYRDMRLSGG